MSKLGPKLIAELVKASRDAEEVLCDTLNAEWGAGNDEHEDVQHLASVHEKLAGVLEKVESGGL